MIKFEYDKNGKLVAYKDGKRVGIVETMGDEIKKDSEEEGKTLEQRNRIQQPDKR